MQAFLESNSFEDTVRNAVYIGGDSDTIAAIAGSVAEAFYGMTEAQKENALSYLSDELKEIVFEFEMKYQTKS
jgi:type I restriction enzyme M protein